MSQSPKLWITVCLILHRLPSRKSVWLHAMLESLLELSKSYVIGIGHHRGSRSSTNSDTCKSFIQES